MTKGPRDERVLNNPGGRSLYKPEYDDRMEDYSFLGMMAADVAVAFGVSPSTIQNWLRDHPSFAAARHRGSEGASTKVARSLYRRAIGYELEIKSSESSTSSNGASSKDSVRTIHIPGDVGAQQFWLKARAGWRDGGEIADATINIVVTGGLPPVPPDPLDEEADPPTVTETPEE